MAQNAGKKGAWVIVTVDDEVIIENTELRALRTAVETGGKLEFVEWGNRVGAPTAEVKSSAKPAVPASTQEPGY